MAKYSRSASKDVKSAMHRKKKGTLKSGKGGKGGTVKSKKQAIAIALSEARKKGKKVPKPKTAKKKVAKKKVAKKSRQEEGREEEVPQLMRTRRTRNHFTQVDVSGSTKSTGARHGRFRHRREQSSHTLSTGKTRDGAPYRHAAIWVARRTGRRLVVVSRRGKAAPSTMAA